MQRPPSSGHGPGTRRAATIARPRSARSARARLSPRPEARPSAGRSGGDPPSVPPRARPPARPSNVATRHANEHGALVRPPRRRLLHEPDAADVVLVVDEVRLERRPLLRQLGMSIRAIRDRHRCRQAQHLRVVLGLPLVVLLLVRDADPWVRLHDDSRLRSVAPRLPRALTARDLPALELL